MTGGPKVLTGDPLAWRLAKPTAVTIGVFDGVHLGHRRVLADMHREAATRGLEPVALTFDPHPLEYLDPDHAPLLLTAIDHRVEMLYEAGVSTVGVLPFLEIRDLAPATFATDVLALRLRAELVAVGEDFRFGRDRRGDITLLRQVGAEHGYEVHAVELLGHLDGGVVSSTRIRGLVAAGDVAEAARLLGRSFELRGPVMHGDHRGRSIGFPTANIHVPQRLAVPVDGVYAARARLDGETVLAVVNIGVRPTFGRAARTVEAHILDFDGDLYGRELTLAFVDRLRDERRFGGVEELVEQIARDVTRAREILEADDDV